MEVIVINVKYNMLKNYLLIAFRNLLKNIGFSLINILGLSIGIAATLLILLWVQDELNYDRFHENAKNLYQVEEDQYYSGEVYHVTVTPYPSGPVWKEEIPEIKDACRYQWPAGMLFKYGDKAFYENRCVAVDQSFFSMFSFPVLNGDKQTLLTQPYSAVLTDETANKYFGDEDPIGKILQVNNKYEFTITGIIKKPPSNSTINFDILVPFEYLKETGQYSDHWGSNSIRTYLQLNENAILDTVNNKLTRVVHNNESESTTDFMVLPFTMIHLHQHFGYGNPPGAIIFVYIFSIIAAFVLLIACINFMNLSTARSASRAKEIGMRKVMGGTKQNLILQFLSESFLLTIISMIFALLITGLILNVFNDISGKELTFKSLLNYRFISGLIILVLITTFIAGAYPSVFLSSFKPVSIIKGELSKGARSGLLRKILVIFQFTLSVILIIGTIVIYKQLLFERNIDLGFNKEHVLYIHLRGDIKNKYYTLKEELLKNPDITGVSATMHSPSQIGSNSGGADWEGKDPELTTLIGFSAVDFDYTETLQIDILSGRSFSKEYPGDIATDSTGVFLINEEVAKIMGVDNPVDMRFDFLGLKGHVIGVMKNFHFQSIRDKIEPLALVVSDVRWFNNMFIKTGQGDLTKTMKEIEDTWNKIVPQYPLEYHFLDEDYDNMYRAETRLSKIVKYFTFLAIIIACLGLFGLSLYTSEQRTREIGIRKVMGSKVSEIVYLLSAEFSILVLISCLIAIPAAYFIMKQFLQQFAYHTDLKWWIFVLAGLAALIIAVLTVIYQSIRASLINPARSLRYE
jgi:putative ABC transport system permease protein